MISLKSQKQNIRFCKRSFDIAGGLVYIFRWNFQCASCAGKTHFTLRIWRFPKLYPGFYFNTTKKYVGSMLAGAISQARERQYSAAFCCIHSFATFRKRKGIKRQTHVLHAMNSCSTQQTNKKNKKSIDTINVICYYNNIKRNRQAHNDKGCKQTMTSDPQCVILTV